MVLDAAFSHHHQWLAEDPMRPYVTTLAVLLYAKASSVDLQLHPQSRNTSCA
jgi:hypothetical protein